MTELERLNAKMAENAKNNPLFGDKTIVFGGGDKNAEIVLIGEAPGKDEEIQKRPFVGSAGKNLSEFLQILELTREQIYITNLVKIRPCKLNEKTQRTINRPPNKDEIRFFTPYLFEELSIINPKIICTLGNYPLRAVKEDNDIIIGEAHGKFVRAGRYMLFPLYHPAAVIYNQSLKTVYFEDLEKLKNSLHMYIEK